MKFILSCLLLITFSYAQQTATIDIKGMTCPLCSTAVKKSLKNVDGVSYAKVLLNTKQATVHFNDNVTKEELLTAIKNAGYTGTISKIDKK